MIPTVVCITKHTGYESVCLNEWVLQAGKVTLTLYGPTIPSTTLLAVDKQCNDISWANEMNCILNWNSLHIKYSHTHALMMGQM